MEEGTVYLMQFHSQYVAEGYIFLVEKLALFRGHSPEFLTLIKQDQEHIKVKHCCNVPGVSGAVSFYPRGLAVVHAPDLIWL